MTSVFLDFVRVVVEGDIDQVSRRLADSPALATTSSKAGAYYKGMAIFSVAKVGLMYEASIAGQKFSYKKKG